MEMQSRLPCRVPDESRAALRAVGAMDVEAESVLSSLLQTRHPNTCRWVFHDQMIDTWLQGTQSQNQFKVPESGDITRGISKIFVYGHHGSGKAIAAATIVERLVEQCDARHAVCHYFCDPWSIEMGSAKSALLTLLVQLAQQNEQAFAELQGCGLHGFAGLRHYTVEELANLLQSASRHFTQLSIVIGSVEDMSDDELGSLLSCLAAIVDRPASTVRLLVTAAETGPEQQKLCMDLAFCAVYAAGRSDDIRAYVSAELQRRVEHGASYLDSESTRQRIEQHIVRNSNGAWNWARCELNAVCNYAQLGEWQPEPPKASEPGQHEYWIYGPDPKNVAEGKYPYGNYFESVLAQNDARSSFVLNRVLKWIFLSGLYPEFHLTSADMCHTLTALLNHHPEKSWYAKNGLDKHAQYAEVSEADVLQICGPLIRKSLLDELDFELSSPTVIKLLRMTPFSAAQRHFQQFMQLSDVGEAMGKVMAELFAACKILEDQGMTDAAEDLHRVVVECSEMGVGETNDATLARINDFGVFLQGQGRYAEARVLYARALAGYDAAETPNAYDMCSTYRNLGFVNKQMDLYDEAEEMYMHALRVQGQLSGKESESYIETTSYLGMLYIAAGRYDEAAETLRRSLAGHDKVFGVHHEKTVMIVYNLALLYKNQNETSEALPLMKRAVDAYRETQGDDVPNTVNAMDDLGQLYAMSGDFVAAKSMFEHALKMRTQFLGAEHPLTQDVKGSLDMVNRDLDQIYGLRASRKMMAFCRPPAHAKAKTN